MKTAVSIPNDIFRRAERLAKLLGMSRSELYSRALREFLARHSAEVCDGCGHIHWFLPNR